MIARLEFDLDKYDDQQAHRRCVKAQDMAVALWRLSEEIRGDRSRIEEHHNGSEFDKGRFEVASRLEQEVSNLFDEFELWRTVTE